MEQWIQDFHDHVEAKRLDQVLESFSPDVEVAVGNNPVMRGRAAAKDGLGGLFQAIAGMKHHYVHVATSGSRTFLEMKVDYQRHDGKTVTVPAVTVIERSGSAIRSLHIYLDIGPVFA